MSQPNQLVQIEPLKDSGQRAWMHVKRSSEVARRETRKISNDTQHETLRPGDAKLGLHASRCAIQAVVDRPHEPHEVEYRT